MRTIVYVDAFNLYYGCVKGTPWRWLDLDGLMRHLLSASNRIDRIKYYTAHVGARRDDPGQASREQSTFVRCARFRSSRSTPAVRGSQFPATLRDAAGEFTKPAGW